MTADDRPTPPSELDRVAREALDELTGRDISTLRAVSDYLEELVAWRARHADDDEPPSDDAEPDAYPDGVPEHATATVTEIAGTEYYYYQWREGDEIRSETVRR